MYDVIVVGSGNAGFSAAVSAKENGAGSVLLIEKSPEEWSGGNTYFTAGAYRAVFNGLEDVLPFVCNVDKETASIIDMQPYTEQDFWGDLMRVTEGRADHDLGKVLVKESRETIQWLARNGIQFQLSFNRQAYKVNGRYKFWGGMVLSVVDGGKGLVENHKAAGRRAGVDVQYSTPMVGLLWSPEVGVQGVQVMQNGKKMDLHSRAVILACGGFEANSRMRAAYLGPSWDLAHVRGTPYNTGDGLNIAIRDVNAKTAGNWSGCHATAWDAHSPADTGNRDITNQYTKSGYPLGVMVSQVGNRFVDEGLDYRNYTYAKFGRAILNQSGSFCFQVWDRKGIKWLRDEEYGDGIVRKITADSLEELGVKLGPEGLTDKDNFLRTMADYNKAVHLHRQENKDEKWDPAVKDGVSTLSSKFSLTPPKTNWALSIDEPPFLAVKVTCGVTFTFGGLRVDPNTAAVISNSSNKPIPNLYAAGEIVGGAFYGNYPGGSGLTIGALMGRKAGRSAVKNQPDTSLEPGGYIASKLS